MLLRHSVLANIMCISDAFTFMCISDAFAILKLLTHQLGDFSHYSAHSLHVDFINWQLLGIVYVTYFSVIYIFFSCQHHLCFRCQHQLRDFFSFFYTPCRSTSSLTASGYHLWVLLRHPFLANTTCISDANTNWVIFSFVYTPCRSTSSLTARGPIGWYRECTPSSHARVRIDIGVSIRFSQCGVEPFKFNILCIWYFPA